MNGSGFTQGSSLFSTPGMVYLASQSTDITIGTYGAKSIYFTTNDSAISYLTINSTGFTKISNGLLVGATGIVTGATGSINAASMGATGITTNTLSVGSITGILKATSGVVSAATAGTDYATAVTITNDNASAGPYYPTMSSATTGTLSMAYTASTGLYFTPSTGTINATNFNSLSDKNKKKNIKKIKNAAEIVNQLNGVEFQWKNNGMKSYGIIAQELEQVIPDLVTTDQNGNKSVNYNGLFGFLINAIKEQQKQIDKLTNK
jgi:hypothetical protein